MVTMVEILSLVSIYGYKIIIASLACILEIFEIIANTQY